MRRSQMMFCGATAAIAVITARAPSARPRQAVSARDAIVSASTQSTFGAILGIKQFANGTVLVDDGLRRRLTLLDSTLQRSTTIADSGADAPSNYGLRPAPLVPYLGDTVLFVDYTSQALVMIGPNGKTGRVLAPPKSADLRWIAGGTSGVDSRGRLIYRSVRQPKPRVTYQGDVRIETVPPSDTAPLILADFDTRTVDTLALVAVPSSPTRIKTFSPSNDLSLKEIDRLLEVVDEWTITSDGRVAVVRGHDYHIDWITADGARSPTPKIPFDWKPVTEQEKQRLLDSARARNDENIAAGRAGYTPDEAKSFGGTPMVVTAPNGTKYVPVELQFTPISEMPDYFPPIRPGAVKADLDGNVWILPATSAQSRHGGLVYDLINRKGELVERVELPVGRSIVGFGRGGIVYLVFGDRTKGFVLERATVPIDRR